MRIRKMKKIQTQDDNSTVLLFAKLAQNMYTLELHYYLCGK